MHLLFIDVLISFHHNILDFGFDPKIQNKLGPFSWFTLSFDWTSHLLDNLFAYWETKSCSLPIYLRIFTKFAEIDE